LLLLLLLFCLGRQHLLRTRWLLRLLRLLWLHLLPVARHLLHHHLLRLLLSSAQPAQQGAVSGRKSITAQQGFGRWLCKR
jgi:hypothetical protein